MIRAEPGRALGARTARWSPKLVGTVVLFGVAVAGVGILALRDAVGSLGHEVLVFEDTFDGSALDASKWRTCYWWASENGCTIASNNEAQVYQPENVSTEHGVLRLEARRQLTTSDGVSFDYTSGMVSSGPGTSPDEALFDFCYGTAEARMKVPSGQGLWPAFWLLPARRESRPEIDIVEILGHEPTVARFHLHFNDENGGRVSEGGSFAGPDFADDWHVFALEWSPDELVWLVDGFESFRYGGPGVPAEPMYVVMNLAVGGDYPGLVPADAGFPFALEVDWIRISESAGQGCAE